MIIWILCGIWKIQLVGKLYNRLFELMEYVYNIFYLL